MENKIEKIAVIGAGIIGCSLEAARIASEQRRINDPVLIDFPISDPYRNLDTKIILKVDCSNGHNYIQDPLLVNGPFKCKCGKTI